MCQGRDGRGSVKELERLVYGSEGQNIAVKHGSHGKYGISELLSVDSAKWSFLSVGHEGISTQDSRHKLDGLSIHIAVLYLHHLSLFTHICIKFVWPVSLLLLSSVIFPDSVSHPIAPMSVLRTLAYHHSRVILSVYAIKREIISLSPFMHWSEYLSLCPGAVSVSGYCIRSTASPRSRSW